MPHASALTPSVPFLGPHAERYRLSTPHTPRAPKIARDFLVTLIGVQQPSLVEPGTLCMSEVVTNAIRHTQSPRIAIDVSIGDERVLVRVHDNRPCPLPAPKQPRHEEFEHGRGLALVEAHAARWGITFFGGLSPRSKAVWFELRVAAEVGDSGAIRPNLP
ncbi:ATP-binding protein [Streptomyces rubradiris]|uniref:ATP-binding protein n=1 Tax=Streptomyces rubradiris TaxID=285531 RepID=UPI00340C79B3